MPDARSVERQATCLGVDLEPVSQIPEREQEGARDDPTEVLVRVPEVRKFPVDDGGDDPLVLDKVSRAGVA